MSWLAPLYLAGLLAIAGPIVFHLWRRTLQGRRTFSTLMFLAPSPPRITRRSRIEQWLLLCLRALACALLALAFARPVLRVPAEIAQKPRGGELLAVLVDTSASLQRDDVWKQVQSQVQERIGKLTDDDTAALFSFDDRWHAPFAFSDAANVDAPTARAVLLERLAAIKPSWGGAQLGDALVRTAQALQEAQAGRVLPRPQRILLVTDLAEGCRLEGLQHFDWPSDIPVELAVVAPKSSTNAGVQYVAPSADLADDKVRVRISNAAGSVKSEFALRWLDAKPGISESRASQDAEAGLSEKPGFVVKVHVPPGQSRVIALPERPAGTESAIELTGDEHSFDNRLWLPFRQPQQCTVMYVGNEQPDDSSSARFYWERALASNPRYEVTVVTSSFLPFQGGVRGGSDVDNAAVPSRDPPVPPLGKGGRREDAPVLALVTTLGEPGLALLPKLLAAGSHVVVAPRTADDLVAALSACGISQVTAQEATVRDYALWSEIDFESPWLAPFAESQFADFSGIHFWRHRTLSEPLPSATKVLVRFDDGQPAVIELPVPEGRVWCFTSGWHPQDSQLARSTKFVPLVWRMLEHALGDVPVTAALAVGQPLPTPRGASAWTITPPDGKEVGWGPADGMFAQTDSPGQYTLLVDGRREVYAVNVSPDESRTDPLPPEQLEAYSVRLSTKPATPQKSPSDVQLRQQQLAELEQHQQLWKWAVLAAVLLIATETAIAAWKGRAAADVE